VIKSSTLQFIKLATIKHNIEDSQLIVNPAMLTDASGKKNNYSIGHWQALPCLTFKNYTSWL
jgi:hypothetical protein